MLYHRKDVPWWFSRLVNDMRSDADVDPLEFPEYLKQAGIRMVGLAFYVDDALVTYAELKWGNK